MLEESSLDELEDDELEEDELEEDELLDAETLLSMAEELDDSDGSAQALMVKIRNKESGNIFLLNVIDCFLLFR